MIGAKQLRDEPKNKRGFPLARIAKRSPRLLSVAGHRLSKAQSGNPSFGFLCQKRDLSYSPACLAASSPMMGSLKVWLP
jgi:hypothetical protein